MAKAEANPYDQFHPGEFTPPADPVAPAPAAVAPVAGDPAAPPAAAPVAPPAGDPTAPASVYDTPPADPGKLSADEFSSQLYDKLNAGDSPKALLAWSQEVGHPITPDENFYMNVRIRDAARKKGKHGGYGRVNEVKAGGEPLDPVGAGAAFVTQAAQVPLFNFGDEIAAGVASLPHYLTGKGQTYEENWENLQSRNDVDWAAHPTMSGLGMAAGALMAGRVTPSVMNIGRVRNAGLAARAAAGAAEGSAYGAASATGEGSPNDRFKNTAEGALIGGVVGGSALPAIEAGGRLVRPFAERLRPDSAKALAARAGMTPTELDAAQAELTRQQGLGVTDSSFLDVAPQRVQDVVGTAGSHDSARDAIQTAATARTTQLPERVQTAADEIVAPPNTVPGTPDEIRQGIGAQRDDEVAAALDPIRATPLPMTHDIAGVLGTTVAQKAMRQVINETADPALRSGIQDLMGRAQQMARATDPRLSEAAQQAAQGAHIDQMNMTIDMSDKISRAMIREGRQTGNTALITMGNQVRDAARVAPVYRDAMARYGDLSSHIDAIGVGDGARNTLDEADNLRKVQPQGAGFTEEPAARFEQRVDNLGTQPMTDAAGNPLTLPNGQPAPSERDLARIGGADQVRRQAGKGPSEAKGVASQMFDSPEQARRSRVLLGGPDAERLAGRMREEVQRVYRTDRQASRAGNANEKNPVGEAINSMHNSAHPVGWLRESVRLLHRWGMSERDANWIVQAATNPNNTEIIIQQLRRAGMDKTVASARASQLRDAAVRYSTSSSENF